MGPLIVLAGSEMPTELLGREETRRRFAEMGGVTAYGTPEQFSAFISNEIAKWGAVVRREGVQIDAT